MNRFTGRKPGAPRSLAEKVEMLHGSPRFPKADWTGAPKGFRSPYEPPTHHTHSNINYPPPQPPPPEPAAVEEPEPETEPVVRAFPATPSRMHPHVTMRSALADGGLLGGVLVGESWDAWRTVLIAAMGEALTDEERVLFQRLSGRPQEPGQRVDELRGIVGRRGGKTRAMAVLAVYLASMVEHRGLALGERGLVLFLAQNQRTAAVAFDYATAIIDAIPVLQQLVVKRTSDTISLSTGIDLEIRSASFRGLRGVTCVAVIADETSFWYSDESSANTDAEILTAVRPSLATTGGPLIVISSPHGMAGEVYNTHKAHYGDKGDPSILVVQGASRDFNPSLPQSVVDRALARDSQKATAEYLGQFRSDLQSFVSREAVEACVDRHVTERVVIDGIRYVGFTDVSGGSSDSFVTCIAHREQNTVLIDAIRETRAPFVPSAAVEEHCELLRRFGVRTVVGDRFAGEWPRERFRECGVRYDLAEANRSELYLAALPEINSRRVVLLDNQRLLAQLCALERRVSGSGRESIDHAPGQHDDVANAFCGALSLLVNQPQPTKSFRWNWMGRDPRPRDSI
jgi:hypothetical protein